MSVIAYRDGIIACDGRMTIEDMIVTDSIKKIAKGDGVIGGFVGDADGMGENLRWLEDTNGDFEKLPKNKASGIVIFDRRLTSSSKEFELFMIEEGSYYVLPDGYYARGSGREFAMAFMDMGLSAKEAVRMTIKRVTSTGGKIFTEKL